MARDTDTPVIRCNDSAKLVSGNLPISSAVIASTTPLESRFSLLELIKLPRIPRTAMTSTSSSALAPASSCATAGIAIAAEPINKDMVAAIFDF